MSKAGAIKLSILFFLIFIMCLPEFFPQEPQIQFLCETFHPCSPENGTNNVHICGQTDLPCVTQITNASSQDRPTGRYLCETEMGVHVLRNNTSESGEHVTLVLTLKTDNISESNVSVFVFLNHTDLYTGLQNHQRLFYCFLPPIKRQCPMNMSTDEPTKEYLSPPRAIAYTLKAPTSANPLNSSLTNTKLSLNKTSLAPRLNCQPTSRSYVHQDQENNETETSGAFPMSQIKKENWWCVITAVWFVLVLTLIVVATITVGFQIYKSRRINQRRSPVVAVLAGGYQHKEISRQRVNSTSNTANVFVSVCSVGDNDVFCQSASTENRPDENLLKIYVAGKRRLSPIYEITENSLNEDEEEEEQNNSITKKEKRITGTL